MTSAEPSSSAAASSAGPSGRSSRWWTVCGCTLSLLMPGALIFAFPGVMAAQWQESLHVGEAAIGGVIFFSTGGLGALTLGSIWFPAGFTHRQRMYVGTIVFALDVLVLAAVPALWGLYLWAFVSGSASVLVYVSALTLAQSAIPERRGLVSGLVSMIFGLSAAVLAPAFSWMLDTLGYERMLVFLAAACLVAGVGATSLVRYSPPRELGTKTEAPGAAGAASRGRGEPEPHRDPARGRPRVGDVMRARSTWALWGIFALMGGAGAAMVSNATGLGGSKGYSVAASLVILTGFNVTNGVSRLVSGTLSDLLGRRATMMLAFAPAGLAYLALPHVASLGVMALLAAIVGFAFGTMFAVSAPLVVDIFGMDGFAVAFGIVMSAFGFFAGLVGPLAAGGLLDFTGGGYTTAMTYLGGLCLASAALVLAVRPRARGF